MLGISKHSFRRKYTIECIEVLEAAIGIEPMNKGFADLCLTTWLRRLNRGANETSSPGDLRSRLQSRVAMSGDLDRSSACQAGEPGWWMAAAVRAPRRELPGGDAEDSGQLLDFIGGEAPLPVAAVAFGGAHGGVAGPAHQLAEPGLVPAVLLAKGPDISADDGGLVLRDLIRTAAPTGHHAPACQMTLYELKISGVRADVPD